MAIPGMTPSALALDDPDFYLADPHAAFRWMRERAPVYRCERARLWAISKHADILQVARNPETFCSARGVLIHDGPRGETPTEVPPSIIYMDPPHHNRYRKLVSRAFTPGMVAGLEGRIRAIARESLDAIRVRRDARFRRGGRRPTADARHRRHARRRRRGSADVQAVVRCDHRRCGYRRVARVHGARGRAVRVLLRQARRAARAAAERPPLGAFRGGDRRRPARGRRAPHVLHDAARRRQRDDAQPHLRRREGTDGVSGRAPCRGEPELLPPPSRRCCAG